MRIGKHRAGGRRIDRLMPFVSAPLFHTLSLLATGDSARFHMPGHKGEPIFETYADMFAIDYTETYGTGNLYTGEGPIRQAEIAAADYWGAENCFFLTGGSTQGVQAMLAYAVSCGGTVLLDRGSHQSVCTAMALLDLTPVFLTAELMEPFGVPADLSAYRVADMLDAHPEVQAVLITSPSYYGVRHDLRAIAAQCHRRGVKLLVDAAHGAHFPSVGLPAPIEEGADLAVLSVHKTLPCLGQGAVLLAGRSIEADALRACTAMFGTSSPSYPILASIDLARAYMEGQGRMAYRRAAESCSALRAFVDLRTNFCALSEEQYATLDPCRLTVCTAETDLTGQQLADRLWSEHGVACEMADSRNAVFILTGADSPAALRQLRRGLRHISRETARGSDAPVLCPPFPETERQMTVRQAWFAPHKRVKVGDAAGQICARPVTPYPPGVPLLYPGEKIRPEHVEMLNERWYNEIAEVTVVASER